MNLEQLTAGHRAYVREATPRLTSAECDMADAALLALEVFARANAERN